ncbi:MAG: GumC family protein, partial [Pseudomonadota bacterium]
MRTDEPSKSYDSIDLLDPLILFWRYRRLVLLIAGVVVAAAVAFALSLAPSYTAIAQVSIGNQQQNYVDIDQVVSGVPLEDTAVSDEISILLSHETMRAVVLGLRLDRDPNYNPLLDVAAGDDTNPEIETSEIALDRTIGSLRRSLTIERQGNSFTLNIRAEAASPRKAALIANAVANAYILEQYKTMQREADRAQNWFTARLEELNEKIASSAQALESFRTQNIERFGESESSLEARLAEVSRQLAVAQAERADREARVQRLHSAGSDPQALSALPEVMRSDLVGDLKNRIVSIEAELARLRVRNGGNHPDTQSRTAELSALERSMVGEIERISEVLENELRQAISIEQQLSGKVQELELARIQQLEGGRDLQSLEATLETDREIYVAFLTRFREVSETATLFQPNTRIVSEARPPQFPSGASRRLIVVLAGLLGL